MIEIACLNCGLVNEDTSDDGRCRLCGARLTHRQVDPLVDVTFGVDYKRLSLGRIIEQSQFRLTGGERFKTGIRTWITASLRRSMGRPWLVPLYKGRVYRFRPISLTDQAPVDRKEVERLTAQFLPFGFEPVMDRMIESAFTQPFERLLVAKGRRLYATITATVGQPPVLSVWAAQGKEGMTVVTDTPSLFQSAESLRVAFMPNGSVQALVETAESMTTVNDRMAPFGVKEFSIFLLNHRERTIDQGMRDRTLRKMRTRKGRLVEGGAPPSCAQHRTIRATRECLVCGKPLCDICVRQVAEGDFCADHLPEGALPPGEPAVDLTGDLAPAGPLMRLALAVGEPLLVVGTMAALYPTTGPTGSKIAALIVMAALLPLWFLYPLARWGATPMGRLLGVAVVDDRGEPPSWSVALVKTGGHFLAWFMLLPAVGFLPIFWDRYRRSWSDRMAGTVTLTRRPVIKEAIGLLIVGAIIYGGVARQEAILAGVDQVLSTSAMAKGGRIALEQVWRLDTTTPAHRERSTLYLTDGKRLGAIGIDDRAILWETPLTARPDRLLYDPYGQAVALVEGARIDGYDLRRGTATYSLNFADPLSSEPVILPRGVAVAIGGKIVCVDRGGETLWEREEGEAGRLFARHRFLFLASANGVELLDPANGETVETFDTYDTILPLGDKGVMLTGAGRVALFAFVSGALVWESEGSVGPGVADLLSSGFAALDDRLVLTDTGAERHRFPPGVRFIGGGGSWAIGVRDGGLVVLDALHGTERGELPMGDVVRAHWIGGSGRSGGRFVLVTPHVRGGIRLDLLTAPSQGAPTVTPLGRLDDVDATYTPVGDDRLLIIGAQTTGLYRLPE